MTSVEKTIKKWMSERLKLNQPIVTVFLQEGKLFFPSINAKDKNAITVSRTAIFVGELSSDKDSRRKDSEVKSTLESLAAKLKTDLKQESVFIIYKKSNWCI